MPKNQPEGVKCEKCKTNVTPIRYPGLSCVHCNRYYHVKCAGLSPDSFRVIQEDNLSWTCSSCKRRSSIIVPGPSSSPSASTSAATLKVPSLSPSTLRTSSAQTKTQPAKPTATQPSKQLSDKLDSLTAQVTRLETLLSASVRRIEALESQLVEKTTLITSLSSKAEELASQTASVEKHLIDDKLEIQGLPDSALEEPLTCLSSVSQAIGCPISRVDLSSSPVRVSKRLSFAFTSKQKRHDFLLAGKKFNKDKGRFVWNQRSHLIHVNEELTTGQKKLFYETRSFAKRNRWKFVWVGISGKILLKRGEGSGVFVVNSESDLHAALLSEHERPADESIEDPQSNQSQ